jgi:hypothetical protein
LDFSYRPSLTLSNKFLIARDAYGRNYHETIPGRCQSGQANIRVFMIESFSNSNVRVHCFQ